MTPGDLLLAWAANSGALDSDDVDLQQYVDPETGRLEDLPDGVVHFDGALGRGPRAGHADAAARPTTAARLFVHYDEFTPGWKTALAPGLPAHVVAALALDLPLGDADASETADPDPGGSCSGGGRPLDRGDHR